MKIQWNKVTWYSKLIAVILFVGVFFLGLWLGNSYPRTVNVSENTNGIGVTFNSTSTTPFSPLKTIKWGSEVVALGLSNGKNLIIMNTQNTFASSTPLEPLISPCGTSMIESFHTANVQGTWCTWNNNHSWALAENTKGQYYEISGKLTASDFQSVINSINF
jgi:hypothetical protein